MLYANQHVGIPETEEHLEPSPDVQLYASPWVSGTRAAIHFGQVSAEIFVPDGSPDRVDAWARGESDLLERLRAKAHALHANAVVGCAVEADPFFEAEGCVGLRLYAAGTAARLEPLWS